MTHTNTSFEFKFPLKVVLPYIFFSAFYIYYSDYLLELMVTNVALLSRIQTYKGIGFVLITGGLLFVLISRYRKEITDHYTTLLAQTAEADSELRKSEEMYWELFNSSPVPLMIFDAGTLQFLLVNEAATTRYGYSKEEFQQLNVKDIRPKEDMRALDEALLFINDKPHVSLPAVYRHITRAGKMIYVKIKSSKILYNNHNARIVTAIDITEEMATKRKMEEANDRLLAASEIANMGYWSNDLEAQNIYWSPEMYKIFEIDENSFQLTLDNIASRFHPHDRPQISTESDDIHISHGISEYERRIITSSGEKWILERLKIVRNENEEAVKLEGITLDITERKKVQQALQESNERFQMVAKAAVEAIIDWDVQRDAVFFSNGFRELFGHNTETNDRLIWSRNIHPEDRGRVINNLRKVFSDKVPEYYYEEFRFLKADGQIAHVEQRGIFVRNSSGWVIRAVGAMIDITESVKKIRKIEQQNEKFREIAWMQSHVVRAPLASMLGLASLLDEPSGNTAEDREIVRGIVACADKLDAVIHDIVKKAEEVEYSTQTGQFAIVS